MPDIAKPSTLNVCHFKGSEGIFSKFEHIVYIPGMAEGLKI